MRQKVNVLKKDRGFWAYVKSHKMLYVMVLPMIVYFLLFNYYPMLGLQLAFRIGIHGKAYGAAVGVHGRHARYL